MQYFKYLAPVMFLFMCTSDVPADENQHWIVTQHLTGFQYDTETQMGERKNIKRRGLVSVSTSGKNLLQSFWSPGAHRATVIYNGKTVVDGYDLDDVSRIGSFRFNKSGSTAYIRTTKGPKAIVELILNDQSVYNWPRLTIVKILSFKNGLLTISIFKEKLQTTEFWRYGTNIDKQGLLNGGKIGQIAGCSVSGSKVTEAGIVLEVYCNQLNGSDVKFLDFKTGKISTILASEKDEILGYSLVPHDKGTIPVLVVGGNRNGKYFYHAVTGALMKSLGEPMSYASDESGKQSWSQSYRTQILATLYNKTRHGLFATLSRQAMNNTLDQQNKNLNITDKFNPHCSWASRIYSKDKKSPISFMINQAMISASLIKSCKQLGKECGAQLKQRINQNASCLIKENEKWFVKDKGLYRIPYGAPFRYDGVWAPWNWHMMWSVVLTYVGQENSDNSLTLRARSIISKFIDSWQLLSSPQNQTKSVVWRYWPQAYYDGWNAQDRVSVSRKKQSKKDMSQERYEDLNHAGISLLGLFGSSYKLDEQYSQALSNRIDMLLENKSFLPRDMDGNGPKSPRWQLGAGWHSFATKRFLDLFSHKLPGSTSNNRHLAYALLFSETADFVLQLRLKQCDHSACANIKNWAYNSSRQFMGQNLLVSIQSKN